MDTPPRRGDLRLLVAPHEATASARLGVVLAVHPASRFTEVALVHPHPELATSLDGVVPGALAGTSYDVVVQSDLRGVVWTSEQVSRQLGRLCSQTLEALADLVGRGRPEAPAGIRIGTPLAGPGDRRWSFKVTEGRALDLLTRACADSLLADGAGEWERLAP